MHHPDANLEKQEGMCHQEMPDDCTQHTREYTAHCRLRHTRSVTYRSLRAGSKVLSRIKRRCLGKSKQQLSHCSTSSFHTAPFHLSKKKTGLVLLLAYLYNIIYIYTYMFVNIFIPDKSFFLLIYCFFLQSLNLHF